MRRILDFIKEKSYFFLGGTVVLLIVIIAIGSCTGPKTVSYESLENSMVSAAKKYYGENKKNLPKEGVTIKVSIDTLIEEGYLDKIVDPKDSSNECSGYVEVTNEEGEYSYLPFLTCKGNYELSYLSDVVKKTKTDEYGNGLYEIDDEYVFRGDDVKNYVQFADKLWRIVKIDSEGDIKLVLAKRTDDTYAWDNTYNDEKKYTSGNTANYLMTTIRKTLNDYYENNFSKEQKTQIVSKDLCIGKLAITDEFNKEKECSVIQENEKIGLLTAYDYKIGSLDEKCIYLNNKECENYNYLATSNIVTWLLTSTNQNTYKVFFINKTLGETAASNPKRITPVIHITKKALMIKGTGTEDSPYIVK